MKAHATTAGDKYTDKHGVRLLDRLDGTGARGERGERSICDVMRDD